LEKYPPFNSFEDETELLLF